MFRFVRIDNTNLVCYRNGTILRQNVLSKKWKICKGSNDNGYLIIGRINGKWYRCHRVIAHAFGILDIHSELQIDHIDLNRSNNNIENLRPATNQQNQFNTNAKGYTWYKRSKKWMAQIMLDRKQIHLGYYDTEEEAHTAYLEAKKKYHVLGV